MANPEHLDKLKEGVDVWNAWREDNWEVRPDLSKAILVEANLSGADLTEADLTGANLSDTDLSRADLSEADLRGANLSGANLSGAKLTKAKLTRANLTGADLTSVQLCTARTLARVILDSSLVVAVCRDCPGKFGPASQYEDGDPRRCGVE